MLRCRSKLKKDHSTSKGETEAVVWRVLCRLNSTYQRIGALKRISFHVPSRYLPQIAQAIIVSKVRYGIGIYGSIRTQETDTKTEASKDLQIALNHAMRTATKTHLKDHIRIEDLLLQIGFQSFNRMSATDKLMLIWQAVHEDGSPLADTVMQVSGSGTVSRAMARGDLRTTAKTTLGQNNFPEPGIRLWNNANKDIREGKIKHRARRNVKISVNSLPLWYLDIRILMTPSTTIF